MTNEPSALPADDKPADHQGTPEENPSVSPSAPQNNRNQNPRQARHRTDKPKRDWFDIVNLLVLVGAFLAAAAAAYEAKRLAILTQTLVTDGEDTVRRQLRAYVYAKPGW